MYNPPHFAEDRLDVLHHTIRQHPLGLMITAGEGGLTANPLPFWLDETGERGTLLAHLARANTQLPDLRANAETLVVFQGPQAYVSPSWYPSKAEHGKGVPTWDYVIVQARGKVRIVDDKVWLRRQLEVLTAQHEAGRPAPWKPGDAPAD